MSFCGNVLELVKKRKLTEDRAEFIQWKQIVDEPNIEVFIEKNIVPELESQDIWLIDAVTGTLPNGDKMGMLLLKNPNKDVYGC